MIILNESILVDRPIQEVFKFTSNFSNIEQWGPGVKSSIKRSTGAVQVVTQYDLILEYGLFRPKMQYRITYYEPYSKVVLKGFGE
jgi:dehydrogenase/reductase SDR family member 12